MAFNFLGNNIFMTPKEKKASDDLYYKKMFPFGKKQQDWEDETIKSLFGKDNKNIPTLKYMCLVRREMYLDNAVGDEKEEKHYQKNCKRMKLSMEDIKLVDSFAKLVSKAGSYDDLPSIDDIKNLI